MIFITTYIALSIIIALSAWANSEVADGLAALTIGVLTFFAGAGLRGSFHYGWQQISGAALAAIVCIATATWIGEDFSAQLFGVELTGSMWGWIGFLASFVVNPGHSRKYAQ